MKKFIYIFGVIIINIFVFGALFKVQHWPGAGVLITVGLGLFCFLFLPLAFYMSYKGSGQQHGALYLAGFICAFVVFTGAVFKIMHWPGAGLFLVVGVPLPFLYFLPVYVYHYHKSKEKSVLNFLGVMLMMVYVALFTAMLSLNVSRDIINSLTMSTVDMAETNQLLQMKNALTYKNLEQNENNENTKNWVAIKQESEGFENLINDIKKTLITAAEGKESAALNQNNVMAPLALIAKDETVHTSWLMKGSDGASGKALCLKNKTDVYRNYLLSLVPANSLHYNNIEKLLNTSDVEDVHYGEKINVRWEDANFPSGIFLVSMLGRLESLSTNVKLAEAEVLEYLARQ